MKVSGFTFIKNAIIYDYPIVEAILSIMPLCDEVVVAIGNSEDETLQLIQSIDSNKIKIIETIWDETKRTGGEILAIETNIAFQHIDPKSDWAIYIQGDEIMPEKYHDMVIEAMQSCVLDLKIDGLLFNYHHFYGSYDYIGSASNWYQNEIRVIRNNPKIYSYKDAQGFRKNNNKKLNVCAIEAYIHHYGWVKEPEAMQRKQINFNKYWHNDDWIKSNIQPVEKFDYSGSIRELKKYDEAHPKVMQKRIASKNWQFEYDISFNKMTLKDKFKNWLFTNFKINLNYQNFKIIRRFQNINLI